MPLPSFYKQTIPSSEVQSFALGGQNLSFNIPRESVIEQIDIIVEGNIATGAATASIEGLPRLINNLQLRGSLAGAGQVIPLSGLSGADVYELGQFQKGSLPALVGSLGSTGFFRMIIPIYLRSFFLGSEEANLMTALPAFRMSDLTLSIQTATQSQVDTNVSPTFAINNTNCYLRIHQSYRETVINDMAFIRKTMEVIEDANLQTQNPRSQSLPAGGDYSLLLVRAFNAANAKQGNSQSAPFTNGATQFIRLLDLSRRIKKETSFNDLRGENWGVTLDTLIDGNACFLFNRGVSTLFQTGAIERAQADIKLEYNSTANTGAKIRYVYERLFDPANLLKIPRDIQ